MRVFPNMVTGAILGAVMLALSHTAYAQDALPRCDRNNPDTTTSTQRSPYVDTTRFRAALDKIQVFQHPTSGECLSGDQVRDGFIKRNVFYLHRTSTLEEMRFRLPSNGRARSRAELRATNFPVATNAEMQFDYTIPSGTYAPKVTIGQLLSATSETNNAISSVPIIRLEMQTNPNNGVRTLMVAFKPSETGDTQFQSLGTIASGTLGKVQIEWSDNGTASYNSNTGQVSGTGKIRVRHQVGTAVSTRTFNVNSVRIPIGQIYFKAGCYTQENGACAMNMRRLTFRNVPNA